MKYFIIIIILFLSFWYFIFQIEQKENNFIECEDYKKLENTYLFEIHRDIPVSLKKEVLEDYKTNSQINLKYCNYTDTLESLGYIQIEANKESFMYKIYKELQEKFNFYSEDDFKSKYYKDYYSHTFYYNKYYETIIETNNNRIQNIHLLDTKYYLNMEILNNLEYNIFESYKNTTYKNKKEIFNIKLYYSNFAVKNIENTQNNILNYEFKNVKVNKDNKYEIVNNKKIKIRSTELTIDNIEEYKFLSEYLENTMNINIKSLYDYSQNNINLELGIIGEEINIEVYYDDNDKIFEIKFLYK